MEFGFFRGLPKKLFWLDLFGQLAFLVDIILQFFLVYRDTQTYKMVNKRAPIALRYLKSSFVIDLLACMPWDIIYKACGNKEEVRYLLWIRLSRVRKVTNFFQKMEKDIRINYLFTRIVKLIAVELYCTHTGACIFYYLATTLPAEQEGYTWIGSLKLGDYSYSHFRQIDLWTRYMTSLYFAIVTMATVEMAQVLVVACDAAEAEALLHRLWSVAYFRWFGGDNRGSLGDGGGCGCVVDVDYSVNWVVRGAGCAC
ncbi:STELAR K+ outward rectifier [Actinidia rufa]|uniref:STELAR K+ outward rectifier n=1 Tax=Actinidia rufa TaxID=165716 RepID=A0A7J0F627_9ERIC|nr:STELAR K+ outward rectifier [Actinidia rufa]